MDQVYSGKQSVDEITANIERQKNLDAILRRRQAAFLQEEETLKEWTAPSRPQRKYPREVYSTVLAFLVLVSIIFILIQEFFLVATLLAFAFVAYALTSVEPGETNHRLTTRGVRTAGSFYRWDTLGRFWFERLDARYKVLHIETFMVFPRELIMVIPKDEQAELQALIQPFVLFEKPEPGFVDKTVSWLTEKIPLDLTEGKA